MLPEDVLKRDLRKLVAESDRLVQNAKRIISVAEEVAARARAAIHDVKADRQKRDQEYGPGHST